MTSASSTNIKHMLKHTNICNDININHVYKNATSVSVTLVFKKESAYHES